MDRTKSVMAAAAFVFALLSFTSTLLAQQIWQQEVSKAKSESITIRFDYPAADAARLKEFRLLRATETGSPSIVATGGPTTRQFVVSMPGGTATRYYFCIRPVVRNANGTNNVGPASEEVIVNRK